MDSHHIFFFFFFFFIFFIRSSCGGFELELIHRDSPSSPLYNASATSGERARDAAMRSLARLSRVGTNGESVESVIRPGDGEFLLKLLVGTPPTTSYTILDTGSDLTWIQCRPCVACFGQNTSLFDPRTSNTYHSLSCNSTPCHSLPRRDDSATCSIPSEECRYSYSYADTSSTEGFLATETFMFQMVDGSVTKTTNFVFGCGYNNQLSFGGGGSGVIGLGRGLLSLTSQLGSNMEKRFSYCLPVSAEFSSKFRFGPNSSSSANKVVSTPLLSNEMYPSLYFLTLEAITVGGTKIQSRQAPSGQGNTVIDSGSTLNYLEPELYSNVISALKELISLHAVEDPSGFYQLCTSTQSFSQLSDQTLIFHFSEADVELKNKNMFVSVHDMTCFSMASSRNSFNIYGNVAQRNFEVEYNLESNVISFAPTNCSQYPLTGDSSKAYTTRYSLLSFVFPLLWFMY